MIKTETYLNYNEKYSDYSPLLVVDDGEESDSYELGIYIELEEAKQVIHRALQGIENFKSVAELKKKIEDKRQ